MDIFVGGSVPNSVRNLLSTVTTRFDSWYQNTHSALETLCTTAVLAPLVSRAGNWSSAIWKVHRIASQHFHLCFLVIGQYYITVVFILCIHPMYLLGATGQCSSHPLVRISSGNRLFLTIVTLVCVDVQMFSSWWTTCKYKTDLVLHNYNVG